MTRNKLVSCIGLSLALLAATPPAAAGVLAPGSVVGGKTIGEWSAEWWKWAASYPLAGNPTEDTSLAHLGNVGGPVFFVPAYNAGVYQTAFTVPAGQYLLVNLISILYNVDPAVETLADAQDFVLNVFMPTITGLHASLDGVPILNLDDHLETALSFLITGVPGGFLPPGVHEAATAGYWLMLDPLPPGPHTLVFGGGSLDFDFVTETRADITSLPEPASAAQILLGALALIGWKRTRRS